MKKTLLTLAWIVCTFTVFGQSPFGPKQSISTNTGSFPRVIDAGKIDNDAFKDIVIGTDLGGTIEWYKNNGNGTFTKQALITSTLPGIEGLVIADLDNDNDNDVIATSYSAGKAVWFQNNGSGGFSSEKPIASGLTGAGTVKAGDIDGNGTVDVVVSSYSTHEVSWFSNNGSGTFGSAQTISGIPNSGPLDFDLADYDNDGDLDVVVAYGLIDAIVLFDNDLSQTSNPTFSSYSIVDTANYGLRDVRFGDVDNDGTLDVIKADKFLNTAWYKKSGGGFSKTVFTSSNSSPATVLVKDVDEDNKQDVIVGYATAASSDKLTWFEDSSTSGEADIDASQNDIYDFVLSDFDNDGDLDMASVSSSENSLNWFENTTYSSPLGLEDFEADNFKYYYNKDTDVLTLKSSTFNIDNIEVYTLLGQKVIDRKLSNTTENITLSNLVDGIYIAEVEIDNTTKAIKFLKQ